MLTRSIIPADVEIHAEIETDCGPVMADPTQIHQIAMNLITNAFHAMETTDGGRITLGLKETELGDDEVIFDALEPGRYAVLSVSDTGCGMSPAVREKIFEPYFTTKEKDKGTGLGLAVVYGIVREYGGDIKVYSEAGGGTVFQVYLPLVQREAREAPGPADPKTDTGNERILIVDDEESIVQLQAMILGRLGYRVTPCTGSPEALAQFRADPAGFDLLITDMTMPAMTGDKLAREVLSIRPDMPIIINTGFSERLSPEKAREMGIKGYLAKPTVKAEMAKMVRDVLDEARGNS